MSIERPEQTHERFALAANNGDVDALANLYEPDAVIVERDGTLTVGIDAVRTHLDQLVAMRPRMRITASTAVEHDGIALLCSHWQATVTPPGHNGEVAMEFRGSEVLRRQPDGTWRLLLDNPWGIDATS
jgi:uncharacterized protein (TIGR02246 family)